MTADGRFAGVDIGGTKISVVVADRDLAAVGRASGPTTGHESDGVVDRIAEVITESHGGPLAGVGVAFPGIVNVTNGTVSRAVNLHWDELPLAELLSARIGAPVWVENDVQAAALAVCRLGLAGDARSLAYVSVGTGIGAAIVIDGAVWHGAHGMAGEIGHVPIAADGPVCSCGLPGCLEVVASGPAVARRATEALASGASSTLADLPQITGADVYRAAANGDAMAGRIVEETGDRLAWAIHAMVMVLGLETVVLGGGLARAGDAFLAPVERGLERLRAQSQLAAEVLRPGVVRVVSPDAEPGAWGALLLARDGVDRDR
jgi:glucokinase